MKFVLQVITRGRRGVIGQRHPRLSYALSISMTPPRVSVTGRKLHMLSRGRPATRPPHNHNFIKTTNKLKAQTASSGLAIKTRSHSNNGIDTTSSSTQIHFKGMVGGSNEAAVRALHGTEEYLHLGRWKNLEKQKIVVFRGAHSNSTCWVDDGMGNRREGATAQGTKTEEIKALQGETVYVMEGYVKFKPVTEQDAGSPS